MQVRLAHLWPDFRVISFCTYLAFSSTNKRINIMLLANFLNPEDRFDLEGTKHFFLLAFTGFYGFYILKQDPLIVQLFSFVDYIKRQEVFFVFIGVFVSYLFHHWRILSELFTVPAGFWITSIVQLSFTFVCWLFYNLSVIFCHCPMVEESLLKENYSQCLPHSGSPHAASWPLAARLGKKIKNEIIC